jgi:hypothetical protein
MAVKSKYSRRVQQVGNSRFQFGQCAHASSVMLRTNSLDNRSASTAAEPSEASLAGQVVGCVVAASQVTAVFFSDVHQHFECFDDWLFWGSLTVWLKQCSLCLPKGMNAVKINLPWPVIY